MKLSRQLRQMYCVYGGYVMLSIIAFGVISIANAAERSESKWRGSSHSTRPAIARFDLFFMALNSQYATYLRHIIRSL